MRTTVHRAALLAATLLAACGGGSSSPDTGGTAPDGGADLPEYELKIGASLTVAANAMAGTNVNLKDPPGQVDVEDLTPVTYSANNTVGGSTSAAKVEFKREGHTLTILANTSATSVANASSSGSVQPEITGICVKARGAKAFKVTWTCDVTTFEANGHSSATVSVENGCLKQRLVSETGEVADQDWNPKTSEETISATDGQACWLESASVLVDSTGGTAGGSASNVATITLTVDPVY